MHRPILLLMTFLLGVASLAVTAVAATIPRTPIGANATSPNLEVVRQYYDAINVQIATGAPSALRELLPPSDRDQSPTEGQDLEVRIDRLHHLAPEVRLVPEPLAAHEDEVIAHVQVTIDRRPAALGFEIEDPSTLWPLFETFRVVDGVIVKHDSSPLGLVSLQEVAVMAIDGRNRPGRLLTVDHSLYGPGGWRSFTTTGGPALLLVTSGELLVTMPPWVISHARLFSLSAGADGNLGEGTPIGHSQVLTADTALLIPTGTLFTVRNQGSAAATALESVLLAPSERVLEHAGVSAYEASTAYPPGLELTPLLNSNMDEQLNHDRLSLGLLTLMPGARISVAATAGPMILLYDTGSLHVKAKAQSVIHSAGHCDGNATPLSHSSDLPCIVPLAEPSGRVVNVGDTPVTARVIVLE
jgi:hypothetical protein